MGFQQAIPPVPDREAELRALEKLDQNWLQQSQLKYYMNESLRRPKMQFAKRLDAYYANLILNVGVTFLALTPVALLSRRLFLRKAGVPVTHIPDSFNRERPDDFIRKWRYAKIAIPIQLGLAVLVGSSLTDKSGFYDRNYTYVQKTPRMM